MTGAGRDDGVAVVWAVRDDGVAVVWAVRDDGVAVVWALALVFVMSVVALLGAAVGERSIERQRAAAAADVAALAAAESPGDPCGRALQWATVNQARLVECRVTDGDIVVRVSRPPSALVRHLFSLLGRSPTDVIGVARAGPP